MFLQKGKSMTKVTKISNQISLYSKLTKVHVQKWETLNPIWVFNAAPPSACHHHTTELPKTLFISVLGNTIFFLFSPFSFFFNSFLKKNRGLRLRFGLGRSPPAIYGPYPYKNRGQNFLLNWAGSFAGVGPH